MQLPFAANSIEHRRGYFEALGSHFAIRRNKMPNTVRLHRVLATKPEKVYRAFIEADALAKWLPPNGFVCTVHQLDAKVGGRYRMSFRNFTTGKSHSFGGEYVELVPMNACATQTNSMTPTYRPDSGDVHPQESLGTKLEIVQDGLPFRWRRAISVGSSRCKT
jgi:activator of Hsp90 ATPase-like protein